jgi:hypothetical protein
VTWQPQVSSAAIEDERWGFCLSRPKLGFRSAAASRMQHFATLFLILVVLRLFIFAPCFCLKISQLGFKFVVASQVQYSADLSLFPVVLPHFILHLVFASGFQS